MDASVSEQTSNTTLTDTYIDRCMYIAAISPQQKKVDFSELKENLYRVTKGRLNTVLHLASAAGNVPFIQQILQSNLQPAFIEKANANGNTALHEAVQRGHYNVVLELLRHHTSLVDKPNTLNNQTPLFKACEGGNSDIVKKLFEANPSKLLGKSSDGRTCLHAVVNGGYADLLEYLFNCIDRHFGHERGNLLKETDRLGNTVLHIAATRNRLDMVKRLREFEPDLSYSQNLDEETAVCVAAKQGFLPVVEELLKWSPASIGIANKNGKNILHLAVELSQVKILKFLVENKVALSQLINQPDEALSKDNTHGQEDGNGSGGDTPLHIAARNKNVYMVDLLLKVPGVGKDAVNNAGLTPLDIARENTEYHESFKIIEKLWTYPPRRRPFLYKAPATSLQKQKKAVEIVEKVFADRRNVELVVAALLATMTFTAVFTVPGGFHTDPKKEDCVPGCFETDNDACVPVCLETNPTKGECVKGCLSMDPTKEDCAPGCFEADLTKEDSFPGCFYTKSTKEDCVPVVFHKNSTNKGSHVLGMPVLIGYDSFKLFLIFDCVAFYLSLFVALMWEMSTPLTTGDKMLFMCITSAVLCTAFAFTAYGLMAAVYSVLSSTEMFGWTVLGSSMFIAFCGTCAFFYMAAKFTVMRARFHSLCGVPRLVDDIAEIIWVKAETYGILDVVRRCEDSFRGLISGDMTKKMYYRMFV